MFNLYYCSLHASEPKINQIDLGKIILLKLEFRKTRKWQCKFMHFANSNPDSAAHGLACSKCAPTTACVHDGLDSFATRYLD